MSWRAVARKDFGDARRDRTLYTTAVLFVAIGVGLGRNYALGTGDAVAQPFVVSPFALAFLLPVTALTAAYDVVPGDRRTGRLRLLLSLPHSRADVVVGTALGRSAVVTAAALALLAVQSGTAVAYGVVPPLESVAWLAVTATLYAAALTSVVVAAGTVSPSGPLTLALGGVAVTLATVWGGVAVGLWRTVLETEIPSWLAALRRVDLFSGYVDAAGLGQAPVDPVGVAVLVGWAVAALGLGTAVFGRVRL